MSVPSPKLFRVSNPAIVIRARLDPHVVVFRATGRGYDAIIFGGHFAVVDYLYWRGPLEEIRATNAYQAMRPKDWTTGELVILPMAEAFVANNPHVLEQYS